MLHSKIFAKSIRKIDTVLIPLKFQKLVFPEIVFISVLCLKIFFLTLSETVNPISHEVGVNLTPILFFIKKYTSHKSYPLSCFFPNNKNFVNFLPWQHIFPDFKETRLMDQEISLTEVDLGLLQHPRWSALS